MTALNISNSSDPDSSEMDDLLVISFWTIILIYALITNTLTVIGIGRSRSMRSASSYHIVMSLAICDLFMIVISLIHIIPATYLHEHFVDIQHPRTIWAMFAYNVFWYTGVVQLAAMAVNRFVSIVYPLHYKRVFSPSNTFVIIGLLYFLGLISSLPSLHECCKIVYDHHIYVTYYVPEDSNYMWLDILLNSLSLLTMIICYGAILLRVRRSTLARQRHQKMAAVVAKARRTSNVALLSLATTSIALSTSADSDYMPASMDKKPKRTSKKSTVNGIIAQSMSEKRAREYVITSGSCSSLSALNKNQTHNGTGTSHKRHSLLARTTSAEPNLSIFRTRTRVMVKRQETDQNSTYQQLLEPASKYRRPAVLINSQQKPQQQASRREIRLFVQFFVVSLVFLSTWVTWQWLPRIPNASKWIYFSTTTFFFVNNAVNPTVYLIFNSGLRHQVKALFCPKYTSRRDAAKAAKMAAMRGANQIDNRCNSSSDESNQNHLQNNTRKRGRFFLAASAQDDYSQAEGENSDGKRSTTDVSSMPTYMTNTVHDQMPKRKI